MVLDKTRVRLERLDCFPLRFARCRNDALGKSKAQRRMGGPSDSNKKRTSKPPHHCEARSLTKQSLHLVTARRVVQQSPPPRHCEARSSEKRPNRVTARCEYRQRPPHRVTARREAPRQSMVLNKARMWLERLDCFPLRFVRGRNDAGRARQTQTRKERASHRITARRGVLQSLPPHHCEARSSTKPPTASLRGA